MTFNDAQLPQILFATHWQKPERTTPPYVSILAILITAQKLVRRFPLGEIFPSWWNLDTVDLLVRNAPRAEAKPREISIWKAEFPENLMKRRHQLRIRMFAQHCDHSTPDETVLAIFKWEGDKN